jgi:eukaryotic-like serine/threonine-protein kinase
LLEEPAQRPLPRPTDPSGSVEEASFLQERLGLLGRITTWIVAAFYAVALGQTALGVDHLTVQGHACFLALSAITLGTWLFCRGRPRTAPVLRALDIGVLMVLTPLSLLVSVATIHEPEVRPMVVLLAVSLILNARSIFIPSSARRTFLASTAAALPACAYEVATSTTARLGVWKVLWLVVAVGVATAASGVIYGLRREVRHARRLGQYTLEEKLGEGGMGVVYRARHALLRRPTAVKLLKGDRLGEASLLRFEREVQLTASLSHPNTVSIYDFGHTPEGTFYYAMEYLEGLSLEQLIAHEGAQPPGRVVHVLRQMLAALAEAHGVGLVHRDVKPANVILCERGGLSDVAKVVDFGLVKDMDAADALSREGLLVGTPHYLAPEAIRAHGADARADLYSVGAVAYFLLTGQHVFEGRTLVEICGHHLHTAPEPPSQRLGQPVPSELERWVLSCLEKDPARRPRTADEAAAALDACGTDTWTREQARSWWIGKGRALAAVRGEAVQPTLLTVSRVFEYDLKKA